jgi:predicted metalloprotease with PDZ domain
VLDTGPAAASGIAPEDVLIAVDGVTFDPGALRWAIAHQDAVALSVARGNQTRTYQIPVGRRWQIGRLRWIGDDRQAGLIAAWLGHDFDPEPGQDFPLDFYSNVHGIETVI